MNKYKKIYIMIALAALLFPLFSQANEIKEENTNFKSEVIEVMKIEEKIREDGTKFKQQDLKLLGLEGTWKNKEIIYKGISDIEVANANFYKAGDEVYVEGHTDESGQAIFYVVDFVRSGYLYILFIIFVLAVLLVGRVKGLKALISLFLSFVVIIKFILPQILNGRDPFLISLIGGLVILGIIIYLTEGWNRKSHLAIISVLFSLVATLLLSVIFTGLTRLTGLAQEEAAFLMGIGQQAINFKGLLLAGMLIGAAGVLDDIVVSQMETVKQIKEANPQLSSGKVFRLAYKVGNTHLGTMVNTLFLTYAGASLPLLLLFTIKQEPFLTFNQVINNEMVATEIVRALVGSIGIALSMPISTYLAARWLKIKK